MFKHVSMYFENMKPEDFMCTFFPRSVVESDLTSTTAKFERGSFQNLSFMTGAMDPIIFQLSSQCGYLNKFIVSAEIDWAFSDMYNIELIYSDFIQKRLYTNQLAHYALEVQNFKLSIVCLLLRFSMYYIHFTEFKPPVVTNEVFKILRDCMEFIYLKRNDVVTRNSIRIFGRWFSSFFPCPKTCVLISRNGIPLVEGTSVVDMMMWDMPTWFNKDVKYDAEDEYVAVVRPENELAPEPAKIENFQGGYDEARSIDKASTSKFFMETLSQKDLDTRASVIPVAKAILESLTNRSQVHRTKVKVQLEDTEYLKLIYGPTMSAGMLQRLRYVLEVTNSFEMMTLRKNVDEGLGKAFNQLIFITWEGEEKIDIDGFQPVMPKQSKKSKIINAVKVVPDNSTSGKIRQKILEEKTQIPDNVSVIWRKDSGEQIIMRLSKVETVDFVRRKQPLREDLKRGEVVVLDNHIHGVAMFTDLKVIGLPVYDGSMIYFNTYAASAPEYVGPTLGFPVRDYGDSYYSCHEQVLQFSYDLNISGEPFTFSIYRGRRIVTKASVEIFSDKLVDFNIGLPDFADSDVASKEVTIVSKVKKQDNFDNSKPWSLSELEIEEDEENAEKAKKTTEKLENLTASNHQVFGAMYYTGVLYLSTSRGNFSLETSANSKGVSLSDHVLYSWGRINPFVKYSRAKQLMVGDLLALYLPLINKLVTTQLAPMDAIQAFFKSTKTHDAPPYVAKYLWPYAYLPSIRLIGGKVDAGSSQSSYHKYTYIDPIEAITTTARAGTEQPSGLHQISITTSYGIADTFFNLSMKLTPEDIFSTIHKVMQTFFSKLDITRMGIRHLKILSIESEHTNQMSSYLSPRDIRLVVEILSSATYDNPFVRTAIRRHNTLINRYLMKFSEMGYNFSVYKPPYRSVTGQTITIGDIECPDEVKRVVKEINGKYDIAFEVKTSTNTNAGIALFDDHTEYTPEWLILMLFTPSGLVIDERYFDCMNSYLQKSIQAMSSTAIMLFSRRLKAQYFTEALISESFSIKNFKKALFTDPIAPTLPANTTPMAKDYEFSSRWKLAIPDYLTSPIIVMPWTMMRKMVLYRWCVIPNDDIVDVVMPDGARTKFTGDLTTKYYRIAFDAKGPVIGIALASVNSDPSSTMFNVMF